jgi:hypothetical protein
MSSPPQAATGEENFDRIPLAGLEIKAGDSSIPYAELEIEAGDARDPISITPSLTVHS